MSDIVNVFVYGTLKANQCRGEMWPRTPVSVQDAYTLGELYGLGAYPALVSGRDRIAGEIWSFRPKDMAPTLKLLDAIEGVAAGLYERVQIECWLTADTNRENHYSAFSYHYRLELDTAARLVPEAVSGLCRWPPR